jgi:two-component system, OmpR family, alkaline phosphatase synthesis response regulator PhoP
VSNILIVEDEEHLANGLRFNLEAEGHKVAIAGNGERALEMLAQNSYDAVVLDVMLPGRDGFSVASELRKKGEFVPILMLTARGRPEDVLQGFDAGADDYLPKPFELKILIARVHGLLRRREWLRKADERVEDGEFKYRERKEAPVPGEHRDTFTFDGKSLDFSTLELRVGKQAYRLTLMEMQLLRYLISKQGNPVSRSQILADVWGLHEDTDTRAIDNFIVRLRRYIEEEPAKPKHLQTVRGVGYMFVPEPPKDKEKR